MSSGPLVTLPTSSCFGSATFGITRVVGLTQSPFTLEEQSFKWPGDAWMVEFSMPPIKNRKIIADWQAFGLKLKGRYGRFLMGPPLASAPLGVATGVPVVDGFNASGNTLPTRGWTANVNGIIEKGSYLQIGTGTEARLYMVVDDANSNSLGKAILNVEPSIKGVISDGAAIIINNPKGVFRLNSNDLAWSMSPGPIYRLSFSAREAL